MVFALFRHTIPVLCGIYNEHEEFWASIPGTHGEPLLLIRSIFRVQTALFIPTFLTAGSELDCSSCSKTCLLK